ncbi:MAG: patatin-like phospholipase family protein [Bryobacterales bacterium]|nr:patatin-like phospholipase family protein [Bryobacterales bacterium]
MQLTRPRIGLALSGGGFRASIFHLGVLKRLAESSWLSQIDIISTVSGGSILGAFLALRWHRLAGREQDPNAFDQTMVRPFLDFVSHRSFTADWFCRLPIIPFKKLIDSSYTRTSLAGEVFSSSLLEEKTCADLPARPYLVMNATTLISMRAWRFTRDGMGDSQIGHTSWNHKPLALGQCVAASAAFPPVFPPMRIPIGEREFTGPIYGGQSIEKHPYVALTDGGVYDNLGLEVLIKTTKLPGLPEPVAPPQLLVVSDAGAPPPRRFHRSGVPGWQSGLLLYRVDEIAREQVSALRRRELMSAFLDPHSKRKGLLVMLGSDLRRLPPDARETYLNQVGRTCDIPDCLVRGIQAVRTHLNRFSPTECEALMYHAYSMTDAFLWAHRANMPAEYRVSDQAQPSWRIEFEHALVRKWAHALRT